MAVFFRFMEGDLELEEEEGRGGEGRRGRRGGKIERKEMGEGEGSSKHT